MFAGDEREQHIARIVEEEEERMKTERGQMETEFSLRMAESTPDSARNDQIMNMDDVQVELNKHLERIENATMKSLEDNKEIWNLIKAHTQTLNTMEEKTTKLMQHVSEISNNEVNDNKTDVHETKDTKEGQHLSDLESRVDSLTEKVNNFVQNVMIVRSLPQKVMFMQKRLKKIEQNIKS